MPYRCRQCAQRQVARHLRWSEWATGGSWPGLTRGGGGAWATPRSVHAHAIMMGKAGPPWLVKEPTPRNVHAMLGRPLRADCQPTT